MTASGRRGCTREKKSVVAVVRVRYDFVMRDGSVGGACGEFVAKAATGGGWCEQRACVSAARA